jgi:hypothetical protein
MTTLINGFIFNGNCFSLDLIVKACEWEYGLGIAAINQVS